MCLHFPAPDPSQLSSTARAWDCYSSKNVVMEEELKFPPSTQRSHRSLLASSDNERSWNKHPR